MKKFFRLKYIIPISGISLCVGLVLFLFFDAFWNRNFRTTQDPISATEHVDLRGVRNLNASGGAAVFVPELKRRLPHPKRPKLILVQLIE